MSVDVGHLDRHGLYSRCVPVHDRSDLTYKDLRRSFTPRSGFCDWVLTTGSGGGLNSPNTHVFTASWLKAASCQGFSLLQAFVISRALIT